MKVTMEVDRKAFRLLTREGEFTDRLPRTRYDYVKDVGDGLSSSVIVATVLWIARQFPEAPLVLRDNNGELQREHPLLDLFHNPNPWYGISTLMMSLVVDYVLNTNAYLWITPRGIGKRPEGLIWLPSYMVVPKGTKQELITHYEYQPGGGGVPIQIPIEDIIHFRGPLDPQNQRVALSSLKPLLREVFTDDEAANFTAAVLRNMGFPGIVISPADEGDVIGPKSRGRIKHFFRKMFRGDQRGEVLVMKGRLKMDTLNVDLAKLNIDKLRQIPEERVTAVFGIPAAVVGFGTGLEQTKVGATMKELRELAYENAIIPIQRAFTEPLTTKLLMEFETDPNRYQVVFDNSEVRVLQEDENRKADRWGRLYDRGVVTRAAALRAIGEETTDADEVYKSSSMDVFIPAGESASPPASAEQRARSAGLKAVGEDQQRLYQLFLRDWDELQNLWTAELVREFEQVADVLAEAWLVEQTVLAGGNGGRRKQLEESDRALVDRLLLAYPAEAPSFGGQYVRVAGRTIESINSVFGLGVMLDDPMEAAVLAEGGTRRGLIDMAAQTREAMYSAISEARDMGLGPRDIARRIRDNISAGPWRDVRMRSNIIARAETRYAQNYSSMQAYRRSDSITHIQIIDAQQGDRHDPVCLDLDGQTFTMEEAQSIPFLQHPNCSRNFLPVVGR